MNTLTDLLLGVGQPRVSHFPDLCTLLYTYLSTLDYWTKIVYYLFTQTSPVAHTSALTPTYIKSQKLPNWPISKELGLGRMLLPHWKLLLKTHLVLVEIDCSMKTQKNEINNARHQVIPWHLADFGAGALVDLACGSWGCVLIRDFMVAVAVTPEPASWAGGQ